MTDSDSNVAAMMQPESTAYEPKVVLHGGCSGYKGWCWGDAECPGNGRWCYMERSPGSEYVPCNVDAACNVNWRCGREGCRG